MLDLPTTYLYEMQKILHKCQSPVSDGNHGAYLVVATYLSSNRRRRLSSRAAALLSSNFT